MIVFVHLLNDRSGSPRVLCSVIAALKQTGERLCLIVGSDGIGCLDEADIETTKYWYKRTPYRLLTLFTYLFSQLCLMIRLFRMQNINRDASVYVNTLLPFGAALYGVITRRAVIYHLHEVSVSPAPLKWFLTFVARHTAQRLIYVSDFHRTCLPIPAVPFQVIYNALENSFIIKAQSSQYRYRWNRNFNILMLASLRDYKGIPEFLDLAHRLADRSDIRFHLVANDDEIAIHRYFSATSIPLNITVHPRTDNPAAFYAQASLVLNLSRPDQWIETFGLTLLEAMAFGIPVIAPPIGGPVELVEDGVDGFLIDCRDGGALYQQVLQLADDESLCLRLSAAARNKAAQFSPEVFAQALRDVIELGTSNKLEF